MIAESYLDALEMAVESYYLGIESVMTKARRDKLLAGKISEEEAAVYCLLLRDKGVPIMPVER